MADDLLNKAKANKPTDSAAFIALVRQYSEDPKTKPLDGDMRFLTEAELTSQYGSEVASASVGLKQLGDLSPLVETQQGFYILRFQGRQAAVNHSLDQVKAQIQCRISFDNGIFTGQTLSHCPQKVEAFGRCPASATPIRLGVSTAPIGPE